MARIYQRMEQLRLGERLEVTWDIGDLPLRALIPGLTVQPLIENAIYHGIELLPDGGSVTVRGERRDDGRLSLSVETRWPRRRAAAGIEATRLRSTTSGSGSSLPTARAQTSSSNRRRSATESS